MRKGLAPLLWPLIAALLVAPPPLARAAPAASSPFADIDPLLRELFENEMRRTSSEDSNDSNSIPLDPPQDFEDSEDGDGEDLGSAAKRSGLRAAMVARGGGGIVLRPGWQIGGDAGDVASPEQSRGVARRSSLAAFTPHHKPNSYINVGVIANVDDYFSGLRNNLELMTDKPTVIQNAHHHGILREGPRPSSSAAYLHALRAHRPSHRVRSFVEDPGPMELRGANSHDPALLWAGLGRRRRRR